MCDESTLSLYIYISACGVAVVVAGEGGVDPNALLSPGYAARAAASARCASTLSWGPAPTPPTSWRAPAGRSSTSASAAAGLRGAEEEEEGPAQSSPPATTSRSEDIASGVG